ncbi:CRP-like cAMP-binding protein [Neolewinella xylanilytica]|uniref:CRP-like cAMP-binding protein n=1 Tax=Neolewinella xylanilytica TaxID=1514080 RepID=A0A2S6IAC3_9BACT|nr:Crp/Fnr family transcriptional regulator [Neolewinella xylanilytica]PPK88450.1 CRP-like cAMP-binding protein [Neolewinella xylanilytica]
MIPDLLRTVYDYPARRESELVVLAAAHTRVHFNREDCILRRGERAGAYYLLEAGLARSYVADYTGREITTEFFRPGQLVIEVASLFQRIPSRSTLQALTEVTAYRIEYDVFQELFHRFEGFREWGRSWMAEQLFREKQRNVDTITLSATERYRALLDQQPEVLAGAHLKHVASYLGITDSSLSRIRKEVARSHRNLP